MDARIRRQMRQHILKLAKSHGIRLHWIPDWTKAHSYPDLREALVPRIQEGSDYLIALHELGHVLSPEAFTRTDSPDPYNWVLCEGAAWAWASTEAKAPLAKTLTTDDWRTVASAFESHVVWASSHEPRATPEVRSTENSEHEEPASTWP